MRHIRRTHPVLIGGAAVALIAGGSSAVALAAAQQPSSDVYQGCLSHTIGTVYNVHLNPSTAPKCLSHDTQIRWNQNGPTGPAGAPGLPGAKGGTGAIGPTGLKGDTGATGLPGSDGAPGPTGGKGDTGATGGQGVDGLPGAAGPAGPAGFTGYEVVSARKGFVDHVGSTSQQFVTAICPGNKVLIGGGGTTSSDEGFVTSSGPYYGSDGTRYEEWELRYLVGSNAAQGSPIIITATAYCANPPA